MACHHLCYTECKVWTNTPLIVWCNYHDLTVTMVLFSGVAYWFYMWLVCVLYILSLGKWHTYDATSWIQWIVWLYCVNAFKIRVPKVNLLWLDLYLSSAYIFVSSNVSFLMLIYMDCCKCFHKFFFLVQIVELLRIYARPKYNGGRHWHFWTNLLFSVSRNKL